MITDKSLAEIKDSTGSSFITIDLSQINYIGYSVIGSFMNINFKDSDSELRVTSVSRASYNALVSKWKEYKSVKFI